MGALSLVAQQIQSQWFADTGRQDGAESMFIERQLESVRAKVYEVLYATLQARMLIPVDNSDDPGAESIRIDRIPGRSTVGIEVRS